MSNTVAFVQCRMGSSRFPGKALACLGNKPLLQLVVDSLNTVSRIQSVVVVTTTEKEDDCLADYCYRNAIKYFRGPRDDVLARFAHAAQLCGAEHIVRITGDCPLLDPEVVDLVLTRYFDEGCDYCSNVAPPTYPDGLDVEVFSKATLERLNREVSSVSHREHVTTAIRENLAAYRHANVHCTTDLSALRWTVDYPSDLARLEKLVADAGGLNRGFEKYVPFSQEATQDKHLQRNASQVEQRSLEQDGPGQKLYQYATSKRIPGGSQLLSKRSESFLPGAWPAYYSRAHGCRIWDLSGKEFFDFTHCGVGACVLGYSNAEVNNAVMEAVRSGTSCTLNPPEEVALADLLCEIHPWAEKVRFTRTGGEAVAVAVRLARAHTGREKVAVAGYHGWSDWYLAANLYRSDGLDNLLLPGLHPGGVPKSLAGTTIPFHAESEEELESVFLEYGETLAALVVEPFRYRPPDKVKLRRMRELCDKHGVVLVLDEITGAFRLRSGGAHLGVEGFSPDIAVFSKGFSNGFAMAAIIGKADVMEAFHKTFISSTYWTERVGPVAALATIKTYQKMRVHEHQDSIGLRFRSGLEELALESGVGLTFKGVNPLLYFSFNDDPERRKMTFFIRRMLEMGFLVGGSFYPTLGHTEEVLDELFRSSRSVFKELSLAISDGSLAQDGFEQKRPDFGRLNDSD